jgi:hypothetical protein
MHSDVSVISMGTDGLSPISFNADLNEHAVARLEADNSGGLIANISIARHFRPRIWISASHYIFFYRSGRFEDRADGDAPLRHAVPGQISPCSSSRVLLSSTAKAMAHS